MSFQCWCLFIVFKLLSAQCKATWTKKHDLISPDVIGQINQFNNCTISLFNFRGLDIDMKILIQPTSLYRYMVKPFGLGYDLYPFELNRTLIDDFYFSEQYMKYAKSLYTDKYRIGHKLSICQVEIYMDPPGRSEAPGLYLKDHRPLRFVTPNTIILADTFPDDLQWRKSSFGPTSAISILAYKPLETNICNDYICKAWIFTVRSRPRYANHNQELQIWNLLQSPISTHIHCRYCDPCNPEAFPAKGSETGIKKTARGPWFSNHLISSYVPRIAYHKKFYESKHSILAGLHTTKELDHDLVFENLGNVFHTHFVLMMFNENITHIFSTSPPEKRFYYRNIRLPQCGDKIVPYAPHLLPHLSRRSGATTQKFPHYGLAFSRKKLCFLSCHNEVKPWTKQLQELVSPFEILTWIILCACLLILSRMHSFLLGRKCTIRRQESWTAIGFQYITTLFDQSVKCFQLKSETSTSALYACICSVPLLVVVLNNHYKGENIERLTVQQSVMYDTFKDLVEHKFPVYSLPLEMGKEDYAIFQQDKYVAEDYIKINNHEAFPIASQLWGSIAFHFYGGMELSTVGKRISETAWYYLNNTQLFPEWRTYARAANKTNALVIPHLKSCNKSAVILNEGLARVVFSRLKKPGRNLYFGKDVVMENIYGYETFGQFPNEIIRRITYFPQTGIQVHWSKYLEFFLIQIASSRKNLLNITSVEVVDENVSNVNVRVLLFIPGFGLLASIFVFIVKDMYSILRNNISRFLLQVSHFLVQRAVSNNVVSLVADDTRRNHLIETAFEMLHEASS